jgi:MbtH protein
MKERSKGVTVSIDSDEAVFLVVLNDEEQYSIWLADKPVPEGWHADGISGSKRECLDHIEQVWTDMRPKSLRDRMDHAAQATASDTDAMAS